MRVVDVEPTAGVGQVYLGNLDYRERSRGVDSIAISKQQKDAVGKAKRRLEIVDRRIAHREVREQWIACHIGLIEEPFHRLFDG